MERGIPAIFALAAAVCPAQGAAVAMGGGASALSFYSEHEPPEAIPQHSETIGLPQSAAPDFCEARYYNTCRSAVLRVHAKPQQSDSTKNRQPRRKGEAACDLRAKATCLNCSILSMRSGEDTLAFVNVLFGLLDRDENPAPV